MIEINRILRRNNNEWEEWEEWEEEPPKPRCRSAEEAKETDCVLPGTSDNSSAEAAAGGSIGGLVFFMGLGCAYEYYKKKDDEKRGVTRAPVETEGARN